MLPLSVSNIASGSGLDVCQHTPLDSISPCARAFYLETRRELLPGATLSPPGAGAGAGAGGDAAGSARRGRAWGRGKGAGLLGELRGVGTGSISVLGEGAAGREMKGRDRSVRGEWRWRRRALAGRAGLGVAPERERGSVRAGRRGEIL